MSNKIPYFLLCSMFLLGSCRKHVDLNQETTATYTQASHLRAVNFTSVNGEAYSSIPNITQLLVDDSKLYMSFARPTSGYEQQLGLSYMTPDHVLHRVPLPYESEGKLIYDLRGLNKFGSSIYVYGKTDRTLKDIPVKHAFKYTPGDAACTDLITNVDFPLGYSNPDRSIVSLHEYQGYVLGIHNDVGYFCLNTENPNPISLENFGNSYYHNHFRIINDTLYSFDDEDKFIANPTPTTPNDEKIFYSPSGYGVCDVIEFNNQTLAIGNFASNTQILATLNFSNSSFNALSPANADKIDHIEEVYASKVLDGNLYISGRIKHSFENNTSTLQNCLIKFDGNTYSLVSNNLWVIDMEILNNQLYVLAVKNNSNYKTRLYTISSF